MHLWQAIMELFFVPHKTVPKLVLPEGPLAAPQGMKTQRGDLLDVM